MIAVRSAKNVGYTALNAAGALLRPEALSPSSSRGVAMLDDEDSYELSLLATANLLHLLRRLTEDEVLQREAVLAILGDAAEALISNPMEMLEVHHEASRLIREEIVPRV